MTWDVDAVIPLHTSQRDILPLVRALTTDCGLKIRVNVIAHRIDPRDFCGYTQLAARKEVRFLSCDSQFPSAGAPRNVGLAAASARWVATVDSDDLVEPGAVTSWVALGDDLKAGAVLPRMVRAGGGKVLTPPTRPGKVVLDPVKDRLAYRVGHLGLTRLETIRGKKLSYREDLRVGEDLFFSYPLWFSGEKLVLARRSPRYVVGEGAASATRYRHCMTDELASVLQALKAPFFAKASARERYSMAVKFLRGQILSAVRNREGVWDEGDVEVISTVVKVILSAVPKALEALSWDEAKLVLACRDGVKGEFLSGLCARRDGRSGHIGSLLVANYRGVLCAQGPVRFALASALVP